MASSRELRMYGTFALLEESGKLEKGERIYFGDIKHKDEAWLRDILFDNPEIIPTNDIDSAFGPLVPLCKERGCSPKPKSSRVT
jgi:hypothetical protein